MRPNLSLEQWMESMNICDYSLLVGFSFLIDEDKKKLSGKNKVYRILI